MRIWSTFTASAIAAAVATPGFVAAQPVTAVEPLQIEEVVVTARKREESLINVPLAVTAISAARITELRIVGPEDIARFTPAFSYVSSFGRAGGERPVIRGQANIQGAANAAFFVDGVYVSGGSNSTETGNLERIEVIKGPQAALYGRATFAGAINYITKRPTNDWSGKATVTAAQNDERDLVAFVSGPLIPDRLLVYAGARSWRFGGEYTNAFTGDVAGEQQTDAGTVKLLWTPTENFDATVLGTVSRDHDPGALTIGFQGRGANNCQLRVLSGIAANNFAGTLLPRSPGYFCGSFPGADQLTVSARTDVLPDPGTRRDAFRLALTTATEFAGGYRFSTVTGYNEEEGTQQLDVSYAAFDGFANIFGPTQSGAFWGGSASEREDFSQELRLESPAEQRLRWRLGGYYFKGNNDGIKNKKYLAPGTALQLGCVTLAGGFIECPQSSVEPLTELTLENRAVFGDVEFDFSDRFTATAELRYAIEESEQINSQTLITPALPACNPALPTNTPGVTVNACLFEGEWKSTSPRVTFRYKLNEDATIYLNGARGNKPGGFNSATAVVGGINSNVPVRAVYDEEKSNAYELGAKLLLLDRRATLNVAVFYTELSGQQLTSNIVGTVNGAAIVNSFIANVGETEIKGIELDGGLQITDRWDARFTFSYVDSKILNFFDNNEANLYSPNGTIRATLPPTLVGPVALCNNRPPAAQVAGRPFCDEALTADLQTYGSVAGAYSPRTPKVQASVSSSYSRPLANDWSLRFSGDVTFEDGKFGQVDNLAKTGSQTYVGARIGLSSERWDLMLWSKNLLDDDSVIDIFRTIDTRGLTPATYNSPAVGAISPRGFGLNLPRGRQVGVTAAVKF